MKHLKLTFVGLLALAAATSDAFAQGSPGPPPMGGPPMGEPDGAASGAAGNVAGPGLRGSVASGNVGGGANFTVFRGGRDYGSGAGYRGSSATAAGATAGTEAEPAAASECDQDAMQICRQQWGICSDVCVTGDAQSQQTCWTGCVNRYNHCGIASNCR